MIRVIGIRHRIKRTPEEEPRPTTLYITTVGEEDPIKLELESDTDELDWVLHRLPQTYRDVELGEDVSNVILRHQKFRKARKSEDEEVLKATLVTKIMTKAKKKDDEGKLFVLTVPETYTGLKASDTVGMLLGGSGDRMAFALSRTADEIGYETMIKRIPGHALKTWRDNLGYAKDDDAKLLSELVQASPEEFYLVTPREREKILTRVVWRMRSDILKDRMACENRIRARLVGAVFCSEVGKYPEGEIEQMYQEAKADDPTLQKILAEEEQRNAEVARRIGQDDVFKNVFEQVTGVGPMIAARLIIAIGDIQRFKNEHKLKAFMGVHVKRGGKYADVPSARQFPRSRRGEKCNWHPEARQGLYLLADQFNRNPGSEWGVKLRANKVHFRTVHPVVELVNGKKRYTDGHIHKMGLWRTLTQFVEWLYKEWSRYEKARAGGMVVEVPEALPVAVNE